MRLKPRNVENPEVRKSGNIEIANARNLRHRKLGPSKHRNRKIAKPRCACVFGISKRRGSEISKSRSVEISEPRMLESRDLEISIFRNLEISEIYAGNDRGIFRLAWVCVENGPHFTDAKANALNPQRLEMYTDADNGIFPFGGYV